MRYSIDADGIATLTFDEPGAAVNTMTAQWAHDLGEAAAQLERDKARIGGVLLASAKSTFFAGAELKGVLRLQAADAAECFARVEAIKRSFRRIETLGRPVVALLNGAALGGGWELALAAHARFALDDRKIRFGTPEVSLGLIPGATGITKTVRLLGLMAAQPYLLEGKLFEPREALELGLVDGLSDSVDGLRAEALAWIATHPDAVSRGPGATGCRAARRAVESRPLRGGRRCSRKRAGSTRPRRSSRRWSRAPRSTTTPRPASRAGSSPA